MPPEPSKPTPTKSTNEIFKDPANDILLCSSDNVTFPFRKLHLESASEVFEGMLSVGREGSRKVLHSDTAALEVVDLAEEAQLLEKYLVFIHPRTANPTIKSYEELEKLVAIADKYASKKALISILEQGIRFLSLHAPALLALSLIYEPPMLAGQALRAFGSRKDGNRLRHAVDDIPYKLYARLPPHITLYLQLRQDHILGPTSFAYSWQTEAEDLEKNPADFTDRKKAMLAYVEDAQHERRLKLMKAPPTS